MLVKEEFPAFSYLLKSEYAITETVDLLPLVTAGFPYSFSVVAGSSWPGSYTLNNPSPGQLRGSFTSLTDRSEFTVRGTNHSGRSLDVTLVVKVKDLVPSIAYPAPSTYTEGDAISIIPTVATRPAGGLPTSFAITPTGTNPVSLATLGLQFDTTTGNIAPVSAGSLKVVPAPANPRTPVTYSIIASNASGSSASASLSLTILEKTPVFSYPTNNQFITDEPVTLALQSGTIGHPTSFTVDPSTPKPAWLSINSSGTISGTPTSAGTTTLKIVGTNRTALSGSAMVTLTVQDPPDRNVDWAYTSTVSNANQVWIVTTAVDEGAEKVGKVYLLDLSNPTAAPKTWTYQSDACCGTRTYVTEVGLFFSRIPGTLFFVSPDTPSGRLTPIRDAPADADANARGCLTSYQDASGNAILGMAWHTSSHLRRFARFLINTQNPGSLTELGTTEINTSAGPWGYSCYIDQTRKYFWSGWNVSEIFGINLAVSPPTALRSSDIPNASIGNAGIGVAAPINNAPTYTIAGDPSGNVLLTNTGTAPYSSAYETASGTVFSSSRDNKIRVIKADCYSSRVCSAADAKDFYVEPGVAPVLGPLSSLKKGGVIALARHTGRIYKLTLRNNSFSSGILDAELIRTLSLDPYMYTDFTGATLYAKEFNEVFDLTAAAGYDAGKGVAKIAFVWHAVSGGATTWKGLKVEARCYKDSVGAAAFVTQTALAANSKAYLTGTMCTNPTANRVQIRITQEVGNNDFSAVDGLSVYFVQHPY